MNTLEERRAAARAAAYPRYTLAHHLKLTVPTGV